MELVHRSVPKTSCGTRELREFRSLLLLALRARQGPEGSGLRAACFTEKKNWKKLEIQLSSPRAASPRARDCANLTYYVRPSLNLKPIFFHFNSLLLLPSSVRDTYPAETKPYFPLQTLKSPLACMWVGLSTLPRPSYWHFLFKKVRDTALFTSSPLLFVFSWGLGEMVARKRKWGLDWECVEKREMLKGVWASHVVDLNSTWIRNPCMMMKMGEITKGRSGEWVNLNLGVVTNYGQIMVRP